MPHNMLGQMKAEQRQEQEKQAAIKKAAATAKPNVDTTPNTPVVAASPDTAPPSPSTNQTVTAHGIVNSTVSSNNTTPLTSPARYVTKMPFICG